MGHQNFLVVLVHGLGGAPDETWGKFPELLNSTFPENLVKVTTYSFPSVISGLFTKAGLKERIRTLLGKGAPIQDLALGLKTELEARYPDEKNIILICHSLGGLVAKHYIVYCKKRNVSHRVVGCLFYAVPHTGAMLASIGKNLLITNSHLKQLSRNCDFIENLKFDWSSLRLDEEVDASYIVSGEDQVVSRLSSMGGEWGGDSVKYIPGTDHRSVVKPNSLDDLSFLIGKNYISSMLHSRSSSDDEASQKLHALFDSYTPDCEPFYVVRESDARLESVLKIQGAWVWGASGVGKTAAIRRMIFRSEREAYFLGLANRAGAGVLELIESIANELGGMAGCGSLQNGKGCSDIIDHLSKVFCCLRGDWLIAIEEIPLRTKEEFLYFLECMSGALVHVAQYNRERCQVKLIFSSIHNPFLDGAAGLAKVIERIRPVEFEAWSQDEIVNLINKIQSGVDIKFGNELILAIIDKCNGNPRAVKHVLRGYLSSYRPEDTIDGLVSRCCEEVLS